MKIVLLVVAALILVLLVADQVARARRGRGGQEGEGGARDLGGALSQLAAERHDTARKRERRGD